MQDSKNNHSFFHFSYVDNNPHSLFKVIPARSLDDFYEFAALMANAKPMEVTSPAPSSPAFPIDTLQSFLTIKPVKKLSLTFFLAYILQHTPKKFDTVEALKNHLLTTFNHLNRTGLISRHLQNIKSEVQMKTITSVVTRMMNQYQIIRNTPPLCFTDPHLKTMDLNGLETYIRTKTAPQHSRKRKMDPYFISGSSLVLEEPIHESTQPSKNKKSKTKHNTGPTIVLEGPIDEPTQAQNKKPTLNPDSDQNQPLDIVLEGRIDGSSPDSAQGVW